MDGIFKGMDYKHHFIYIAGNSYRHDPAEHKIAKIYKNGNGAIVDRHHINTYFKAYI